MKIYLAHNFQARLFLRNNIVPLIEAKGHQVTSMWITSDDPTILKEDRAAAEHDLADVSSSDILILFTEHYCGNPGRGKYIEYGYAMGLGMEVITVGTEKDTCFFELADAHYNTIQEFLDALEVV